jgi:hypothetical protein
MSVEKTHNKPSQFPSELAGQINKLRAKNKFTSA